MTRSTTYDPQSGRPTLRTDPAGLTWTRGYDDGGRADSQTIEGPGGTVASFELTYDEAGNVASEDQFVDRAAASPPPAPAALHCRYEASGSRTKVPWRTAPPEFVRLHQQVPRSFNALAACAQLRIGEDGTSAKEGPSSEARFLIRATTLTDLKLEHLFRRDGSEMVALLLADPDSHPRVEPPEGFVDISHRYRDDPEDPLYDLLGAWEGTAPSERRNCLLTFEKALDPKLGAMLPTQDLFNEVLDGKKELFEFSASCAFRATPVA